MLKNMLIMDKCMADTNFNYSFVQLFIIKVKQKII